MKTLQRGKKALVCALACACLAFALFGLAACGSKETKDQQEAQPSQEAAVDVMRIGTLQTEDSLPFWAAQQLGYYQKNGVDVEIITFQSAQELSAAFAASEIDGAMTDVQVSAALAASGMDIKLAWVTLGEDATQGRFGIMTSPESGITSLKDLAGKGIGVGSNTVPEYVMDQLMLEAGVPQDQIVGEEIKKIPVRYEAMANNQVAAAALPGSLLALGESQGMVLLADDTQGENISQSVFAVNAAWVEEGGQAALDKMASSWNAAAAAITADPESFRALLIEKANLPERVAQTYPVATYPGTSVPGLSCVQHVLNWMEEKGYLGADVSYNATTGILSTK